MTDFPAMTTTDTINITGLDLVRPSASELALATRDEILVRLRAGTAIPSPESAVRAAELLREAKGFCGLIESHRKAAKAPVLDIGRAIDGLALTLTSDMEVEVNRVGQLLAAFQEGERRREEDARRRAAEEQARILREQQEREAKARAEADAAGRARREAEANAAREAAELEAKAARARSAERQAELNAQASAKREAAAAAYLRDLQAREDAAARLAKEQAEAAAAIAATNTAVSLAAAHKIEGMALRHEMKFEVTDIHALFEALPGMVILSPNTAAIKAHLKTLPEGTSLPGVRHWKEAKTSIR
jgi:hypothetical protein